MNIKNTVAFCLKLKQFYSKLGDAEEIFVDNNSRERSQNCWETIKFCYVPLGLFAK